MSEFSVKGGLFASLKRIAATLLASGRTRLELLANEIEEEKVRATQMLMMALGAMFCLGAGVLVLILFLAVLFWESKVVVLGASCLVLLLLGLVFVAGFRHAAQRPDRMFAASLAELEEDLRQLKAAVGQDAQSQ